MHDLDDDLLDTLDLTGTERAALEAELLSQFIATGNRTFKAVFANFEPRWALEALDRLVTRGLVEMLPGDVVGITAAGHEAHMWATREAARRPIRPTDLMVAARRFW